MKETFLQKKQQELDLFASGPVMTITWNPAIRGEVQQISPNVTGILGYTPEEITNPTFRYDEIIHSEDREKQRIESETLQEKGLDRYSQYYRLKTKAGDYRWFYDQTQCIQDTTGKVLGYIGYLIDQTDLMESQQALETERRRLADIIEATNVGTWERNMDTGETTFNERWAEMVGHTLSDLEPTTIETWTSFVHPEDLSASEDQLQEVYSGNRKYYDIECRMKHKNGHWIWVQDKGKVVSWSEEGKPLMMSGTITDITHRKEAGEALKLAKEQAETANVAKNRYLAHMNHEMRTPLNGFMGFLQLLETTRLDEEQQTFMQHMKQSADHMLGIINNVLDYAKIEAGQMKLDHQPFHMEEEVQTAMAPLHYLARQQNLSLELTLGKNLPQKVVGDPQRLRQIILNLGGNAVKFTPKGQVNITINCPETTVDGHLLKLVVEDTGPGMTEETLAKLFQPFYQADDGSTPQAKGTGLGLSITRELVELMGGRIQVNSIPGKGTRVEVDLMLMKTPEPTDKPAHLSHQRRKNQ